MKRFFFTLILIAIFTPAVFSQYGTIRELSGEVGLMPAGATAFTRASLGDIVAPDTIVSTGFRSSAIIAVGHSVITVRPLTRLSFTEIQRIGNTESISLDLQTGRIRVDINTPPDEATDFTVRSSRATASVRGTSFEFDTYNVSVDEGRVIFSGNIGIAVIVTAGGASFVQVNRAAADPAAVIDSYLAPPPPIGVPYVETPEQPDSSPVNLTFGLEWLQATP